MTDTEVNQGVEELPTFNPVIKATVAGIEFNLGASLDLSDGILEAILIEGFTSLAKKANGAVKALAGITKLKGEELEDRKKVIMEAVEKTIQQLKDGIVPGRKVARASGAVNVEAMRLAKAMVKDLIRNSGQKIGAYSAKEQTAAAKVVLERNPHLMQLAEKNLSERASDAKGSKALDLKGLFGAKADSEEVKAKPKAPPKRKEKGTPISAKQAGMAAPRQKPGSATAH